MATYELSLLNIIVLFGAFQGFVLAFILVTTPRFKKKSNAFLALLLVTISALSVMITAEDLPSWEQVYFMKCFPVIWMNLIPPSIYFFIRYLIQPSYQFKRVDALLFLPFLLEFCYHFVRFLQYNTGTTYTGAQLDIYFLGSNIFELIALIGTLSANIYAIYQLKIYEKRLYENYSEVQERSLNWLRNTLIAGVVLSFLWAAANLSDFYEPAQDTAFTYPVMLGLALLIYWIGYCIIIRQQLLDTPIFAIAEEQADSTNSGELSAKTDDHYRTILDLLETKKLYRDPNLNMSILSEHTGLSNGYLSQIINQKRGQNFFDLVNGYRIEEVKEKIADRAYDHYSILGIAQEAGFKSKSTFNSVFKKMTGKTPSQFKKDATE